MGLGSESLITEVRDLLGGRLVIPSIQRGYVWQRPQVPHLLDSLYRGYPVGSLLLWKTTMDVPLRQASVLQQAQHQLHPAIFLDGQQRLTSLAKVFAPEKIVGGPLDVRFDIDGQTFLNPSGAQKSRRLVRVSQLIADDAQFSSILRDAGVAAGDPDYDVLRTLAARQCHPRLQDPCDHRRVRRLRRSGGDFRARQPRRPAAVKGRPGVLRNWCALAGGARHH